MSKKSENVVNIKDDKMDIITNDIERLRKRTTVYIGSLGRGILHLVKELVANSVDECSKDISPGNTIKITIENEYVTVSDNGRGIATDLLQIIHETMQAGSNMTRENGDTTGENGTGTSTYTALSAEMTVTSFRPQEGKKLTLRYEEGELKDKIEEEYHGQSGLTTRFKPSKKIFGSTKIPVDDVIEWLGKLGYTLKTGVAVSYTYKGEEHYIDHKTMKDFINERAKDNLLSNILTLNLDEGIDEFKNDKVTKKHYKLEAAFAYTDDAFHDNVIKQSWMNRVETIDHGYHVSGVEMGIFQYLSERAIVKKPALAKEKLDKDFYNNFNIVVKCSSNIADMFEAQSKTRVTAENLGNAITTASKKWCSNHANELDEFVDILIQNNHVRKEGEKSRFLDKLTKQKRWDKPSKFIDCSLTDERPKELYIVEGNSAQGGLFQAKLPFQAILPLRGNILSVWDLPLEKAIKNEEIKCIAMVMECGTGKNFSLDKMKYSKVIIATDADVDGYHIRSSVISMYIKYFPEIVEAGRLWIAEPPLYSLKVKGVKEPVCVATNMEKFEECLRSIGELNITFPTKVDTSVRDFMFDTVDYSNDLVHVANTRGTDFRFLEYVAMGIAKYDGIENFIKHFDEWIRSIVAIYPETTYTGNVIRTCANNKEFVLMVDDDLNVLLKNNIRCIKKYGFIIEYSLDGGGKHSNTLYEFFDNIEKLYPQVIERYKGLGQSPKEMLHEKVMNPETRRLIKVTMDDTTHTTLTKLFSKKSIDDRKEMLMNYKYDMSIIDN